MGELKLVTIEGVELQINGDGEPRIQDLTLATKLGYERPRKIRDLIARLLADGKLNESEVRTTAGQTSELGGRPGREYWLTEEQALFVCAKSETEVATSVLREVIHVYSLARRGQLPTATPDAAKLLPLEAAVLRIVEDYHGCSTNDVSRLAHRRGIDVVNTLARLERDGRIRGIPRLGGKGPRGKLWYPADAVEPGALPSHAPRPRRFDVGLPCPALDVLRQVDDYGDSIETEVATALASVGVIVAELSYLPKPLMPNAVRAHGRIRQHALRLLETLTATNDLARSLVAAVKESRAA